MSPAASPPSARTRAYVNWVLRHGKWLWIAALLLAVFTVWRTTRLYMGLRSELELLLPQSAPSVAALQELRARMPGIQFLGIVVDSGTAESLPAAERFADDLAQRIRSYPPGMVAGVRTGISEERKFLENHAPLYADLDDLVEVRKRIEARRDYEATKAMGADLDDDEPPPPLDFSDLEKRYKDKAPQGNRFPNDRFSSAKEHATVLLVEISGYSTGTEHAKVLLDRIRADAQDLGFPQKYAPGLQMAFTGDPAIRVEELSALVTDLTFSTLVIVGLVILTLIIYFRWWRAVPAIVVPLLLAASYSFALAGIPPFRVRELNSNTAFLGSIIIGNGINFAIILVARYLEERRAGADVPEALAWAVHSTRVGTVTAAAAAGIAYGSLMVTQFRGFWQFGVIGGMGMIVCWATTFLLVPPMLAWLDSKPSAAPRPIDRYFSFTGEVAKIVSRRPGVVVGIGALITVAALIGSRGFGPDRLETDYSKLRRRDTWQVGEGFWGRRMDAVLGRYLTPLVVMTDSAEQTRSVAEAIRQDMKHPPLSDMIASVSMEDNVLPRDQAKKIEEAKAIRKTLTPKIRSEIPEDKRELVDRMLGDGHLRPLTAAELPSAFVAAMRERDGSIDKAVLLYPKLAKETWQGMKLVQMAAELRKIAAQYPGPDGRPPRIAGQTLISADITTSMLRDGPLATAVAIGGVIALIIAAFRFRRETVLVFGSLVIGVLWLVWGTMLFDIRLNFANFIGFPITFGIGVDYAVNVMWRYRLDGGRDVIGAIKSTGGAVGMCSLTTIIGYSSLLMAQNQALFSFGLVAVIGEFTCLATAVLLLPATLLILDRRRERHSVPAAS